MSNVQSNRLWCWSIVSVLALAMLTASGCVLLFKKAELDSVDLQDPPTVVTSPLKVHLTDGSITLFREGAAFRANAMMGEGMRYGIALEDSVPVRSLALDSVAAVETYREGIRPAASLLASTAATGAGTLAAAGLMVAIFGSCPTVYSQSDSLVLEAESFSNSIVPLFEMRDVDYLHAAADSTGGVTLEIRNEALETHYINHLELLEVQHAPHEEAIPGDEGRAWIISDQHVPSQMMDQAGRDVTNLLATADGKAYRTPSALLAAADSTHLMDYIDLSVPARGRDTVMVSLRLRNSLLNTLLLYEYMLAGQGPRSLDWLGQDLEVISSAIELSEFYASRMGLRVQVLSDRAYRTAGRVREVGPIAWSREIVPVPVPAGSDSVHIRLSFVTDAWRIDRVGIAYESRSVYPDLHALASIRAPDHDADSAMERLRASDKDYWVTLPTDRFWARFEPGPTPEGVDRTFFLAAQGYYTEWIRRSWLDGPNQDERFVMSDQVLEEALQDWHGTRQEWEASFESTKLPVQ